MREPILFCIVVFFISLYSAYKSKKRGLIVGVLLTSFIFALTYIMALGGVDILLFGLVVTPVIIWLGFWLGCYIRIKHSR